MELSLATDSSAKKADKESQKFRVSFKMPGWKKIGQVGINSLLFLWKWLKWPALMVVAVVSFLLALYYLIGPLLGLLLQLAMAIITIPVLCLWASVSHLFGGADLTASYSYWPISKYSYDMWDWGVWTLEGSTVYVVGGLTGLLLAYMTSRPIRRFRVSRAQEKKRLAEAVASEVASKEKSALDARFAEGLAAGVAQEQVTVRRAFLHAYTPKMTLPPIPEGGTRVFWINVRLHRRGIQPTEDRAIHWADITEGVPEFAIGAPAYQRVVSTKGDRLAMMTVVFTLNGKATAW